MHPNLPLMGFDDGIDKKETETDAGRSAAQATIHTVVPIKYPGQVFGRDADAFVRHIEHQPSDPVLFLPFLLPAANPNAAAFGRVFDRIAEQIGEDLTQALFVTINNWQIGGQIQRDRVRVGLCAVVLRHSLEQSAHMYVGAAPAAGCPTECG